MKRGGEDTHLYQKIGVVEKLKQYVGFAYDWIRSSEAETQHALPHLKSAFLFPTNIAFNGSKMRRKSCLGLEKQTKTSTKCGGNIYKKGRF